MFEEKLIRPYFNNGTPSKAVIGFLAKSDDYIENHFKILSLGGLGYGVLAGYKESLSLAVEGSILVVKSGAAIDKYGNLIYLPQTETIKDKISIREFQDKTNLYVYIRYKEEKGNLQPHREAGHEDVHTEYVSSYNFNIGNVKHSASEWIELGRIAIDYHSSKKFNHDIIANSFNAFLPQDNQIDLRYVPKIITNLVDLKEDENEEVYKILGKFADYLNEIAFKYHLFSSSTASSFVYQVQEDIFTNIITPYDFYRKLKASVDVVLRIGDENELIQKTDFWKNIKRLKELFSVGIGEKEKIDFYTFNLERDGYFRKILYHFKSAGECSRDVEIKVKKEFVEEVKHKGYVQVGRSAKEKHGNDLIVGEDDRTVSRIHLIITAYKGGFLIEDKSATGTFVNAQKIEKGTKQFVKPNDEIVLGRKSTKLNLNEAIIQDLLNL